MDDIKSLIFIDLLMQVYASNLTVPETVDVCDGESLNETVVAVQKRRACCVALIDYVQEYGEEIKEEMSLVFDGTY